MAKSGKKLVVAIVVLVLAVALATTATFAWFTMNQSVTVGNIDMDVTSNSGGLYVSLSNGADAVYSTELTSEQIKDVILTNAGFVKDGDSWKADQKLALKDVTAKKENNALSITDEEDTVVVLTDASYAQFTIYFRATDEMEVSLDLTGTTGENDAKQYNSKVESTGDAPQKPAYAWDTITADTYGTHTEIAKGAALVTRAANAARVGFEPSANSVKAEPKIWNPNSDQGFYKGNLAQDYRNKLLGTTTNVSEVVGDIINRNADVVLVKLVKAADAAYYEGQITVTVWIEGTDGDCFTSILSDNLKVSLQFKGKIVEQVAA